MRVRVRFLVLVRITADTGLLSLCSRSRLPRPLPRVAHVVERGEASGLEDEATGLEDEATGLEDEER